MVVSLPCAVPELPGFNAVPVLQKSSTGGGKTSAKTKKKVENAVTNHCFCTSHTFSSCKMAKFFKFLRAWENYQASNFPSAVAAVASSLLLSSHTKTNIYFFSGFYVL